LDEVLAVAVRGIELALEAGATQAEATSSVVERFSTEARDATIVKLEQSTGRSLTVRAFADGAKATLSTTDLSGDGLRALVQEVVDAARFVARDPLAGLPDRVDTPPPSEPLELYFDDVRARPPEAKIDDARELEATARAHDPRISNSGGSRVNDAITTIALANSRGFRGAYRTSTVVRSTSPIAQDGDMKRNASYGSAARSYADVESSRHVATVAARRAVAMCGASKPGTMRVPVIFERDVAAAVLGDIFTSISAANVAVGNSFLAGRVGERIGSDLVTIVDDGLLPRGLGSSPFDAEGVPPRKTVVFERGTLRTFLYDTYYGRKLGAATTGNSSGNGIGPNNFYLLPGERTLEELIAATPRGVLILDTIGFATESVTGTYSRGARGFVIENGEIAYPIDEFTIAGNLATMLGAVDAIANDLRFDGAIVSPSFRVAEMTVSGN
jgi:PmbA protein